MNLYEEKGIKPMLIAETNHAPFDSPDFIFELKLDGLRCIAYLDPASGTDLRNKRDMKLLPRFPELEGVHRQVRRRCILDGELIVTVRSAPDFYALQRRSILSIPTKVAVAAKQYPATFVAFDIIDQAGETVNHRPLMERKTLLANTVIEGGKMALTRYVREQGVALYRLAEAQELEGVVAKRMDSKYYFDKRTRDWKKIKRMLDDDFVICGYLVKSDGMSLVLGQYGSSGRLCYRGHVPVRGRRDVEVIRSQHTVLEQPFDLSTPGHERAVWIKPLVCTVNYMPSGKPGLRQPVFKGLREDKQPKECKENSDS